MFQYIIYSYLNFIYFFFMILGFLLLLIGICYLLSTNKWNFEKNTHYECGFDPFSDTKEPFDIKFCLIAIMFIIFDLEILFFLLWVVCEKYILLFGYYIMYIFFTILILGFFYEYKKGALDWN